MFRDIIAFTASRTHVVTYLLCIALFSISFLVFLNSSISFVITERIGDRDNVGDAVGTLGFADELVALVACPVWGLVSDRIGVRTVAVLGYTIVGCSLFILVQSKTVYPQLLMARMFFSIGGAATATMVTAILPSMTFDADEHRTSPNDHTNNGRRHVVTPSISSELTITPARWRSQSPTAPAQACKHNSGASTSRLAGIVGMFTGLGALIALFVFLPLPTRFENAGHSRGTAVAYSFYVVGAIAFLVAILCLLGLHNLPGEDHKRLRYILHLPSSKAHESSQSTGSTQRTQPVLTYAQQLFVSLQLAFEDHNIGLGYLGGFVARASSVAISLFIPLFCNAYFISSGRCPSPETSHDSLPPDFKHSCHRAYILASILSGTSQLIALICAPVFGYLASRTTNRFNPPLLAASITGIAGYVAFALIQSPDPKTDEGSSAIFFVVALLGISQIGAIVCSLSLLGRGIQNQEPSMQNGSGAFSASPVPSLIASTRPTTAEDMGEEAAPLLTTGQSDQRAATLIRGEGSRTHLKGSIAGLYSLLGGVGILLLTKTGGALFDSTGKGAPFWMMALFNAALAAGCVGSGFKGWFSDKNSR